MTVAFNQVPANARVPLFYAEINPGIPRSTPRSPLAW
jgi:phage tail sheath gpL-like